MEIIPQVSNLSGHRVNLKLVPRLIRSTVLAEIASGTNTKYAHPHLKVYPSLLRGVTVVLHEHHPNPRGARICLAGDQHGMSFSGLTQLRFTSVGLCSEKTAGIAFKHWVSAEQLHGTWVQLNSA